MPLRRPERWIVLRRLRREKEQSRPIKELKKGRRSRGEQARSNSFAGHVRKYCAERNSEVARLNCEAKHSLHFDIAENKETNVQCTYHHFRKREQS